VVNLHNTKNRLTISELVVYTVVMVRTIIKPNKQKINLSIPAEYIGKEVEILVFPINKTEIYLESDNNAKRQKAFERFMKYQGKLPVDFDHRKELADYRNERYGHIN